MVWFRGQDESDNEFGEYLPEEGTEEYEESERLEAFNKKEANQKCREIAKEYGGSDPQVERIDRKLFDCKFKLWR